MSRGATLSLMGMWQFDNTILDSFVLPAGIDRDILFPDLLAECAEFEILYPEPDTFKTVLLSWSNHRSIIWDRIQRLTQLNYDPIENYDRSETWTDTGTSTNTVDNSEKGYQGGFNPNILNNPPDMVQQEQVDSHGAAINGGSTTHTGRVHGNIGVRSSQELMEQELNISEKLDVYRYIIMDFQRRFCIPLY